MINRNSLFLMILSGTAMQLAPGAGAAALQEDDLPPQGQIGLHCWDLDETTGITAYDTGLSNTPSDGTSNNGVLLGQPGVTPDSLSPYFWPNYLEIPHVDSMALDAGTISFSFLDTGAVLDAGLFTKDANGLGDGGHLSIGIRDGHLRVRLQSDTTSYTLTAVEGVELDRWYDVDFSFGEDGMKLYVDDVLVASNDYTGGIAGNSESIIIGAATSRRTPGTSSDDLRRFFSGNIDNVKITAVPEPSSMVLAGIGMMMLGRRRRHA